MSGVGNSLYWKIWRKYFVNFTKICAMADEGAAAGVGCFGPQRGGSGCELGWGWVNGKGAGTEGSVALLAVVAEVDGAGPGDVWPRGRPGKPPLASIGGTRGPKPTLPSAHLSLPTGVWGVKRDRRFNKCILPVFSMFINTKILYFTSLIILSSQK